MLDRLSWRAALLHATIIAAALIVFVGILFYTESADLLFAIVGGVGTGLLIYLVVHIFRDKAAEE